MLIDFVNQMIANELLLLIGLLGGLYHSRLAYHVYNQTFVGASGVIDARIKLEYEKEQQVRRQELIITSADQINLHSSFF